jgi:phenylacetic acid degradation operon negative regulatory protein
VNRCWDLLDLNRRYAGFVGRHRGDFLTAQRHRRTGSGPTPEQGFVLRFWVTYEYSSFPRQDPNLPDELLPRDWQGDQAAQLLADYRDMLRKPAEAFIQGTLGVCPPGSTVAVESEIRAEETFVGWP